MFFWIRVVPVCFAFLVFLLCILVISNYFLAFHLFCDCLAFPALFFAVFAFPASCFLWRIASLF